MCVGLVVFCLLVCVGWFLVVICMFVVWFCEAENTMSRRGKTFATRLFPSFPLSLFPFVSLSSLEAGKKVRGGKNPALGNIIFGNMTAMFKGGKKKTQLRGREKTRKQEKNRRGRKTKNKLEAGNKF